MDEKQNFSYLFGSNAPYIEELYEEFLNNPDSVEEYWRQYFSELAAQPGFAERDVAHRPIQESFVKLAKSRPIAVGTVDENMLKKQVGVLRLISAYRIQGVGAAQLDPLKRKPPIHIEGLDPKFHGLSDEDMAVKFNVGPGDFGGRYEKLTLSEILSKLKQTYCGSVGIEYMHITNRTERRWIRDYFESVSSTPKYDSEQKLYILKQLTAAETLERYLQNKYVGQKRFGVEGGESSILALNYLVQNAGKDGVEEVIVGMAHRGRLNVLVNTLGKKPSDLFAEFEGRAEIKLPSGDVKYHTGFSSDIATPTGPIHVTLAFNPSHLEIVNPVVEGSSRAKQTRRGEDGQKQVLPVLIHGDSAFIGLGVNQAVFNMSLTRGYTTGGTVHVVVNNQIGFTTSDTRDTRSTVYCTDIAKMVDAPIFHVNGDDPEAVCMVMQAAMDYRKTFHKDVVVDVVCYRKNGHNESDDPTLTQPMMYKAVAKHPHCMRKNWFKKVLSAKNKPIRMFKLIVMPWIAANTSSRHACLITPANTALIGQNIRAKTGVKLWKAACLPKTSNAWPINLPMFQKGSACTTPPNGWWRTAKQWRPANRISTGAWRRPSLMPAW